MKIYRAKDTILYLWDFKQWLADYPEVFKQRIGISWKKGKRRKLRSYHVEWNVWECDCCGPVTSVTFRKGNRSYRMDNHFGPGYMYMTEL
jgi:hypothetical protein